MQYYLLEMNPLETNVRVRLFFKRLLELSLILECRTIWYIFTSLYYDKLALFTIVRVRHDTYILVNLHVIFVFFLFPTFSFQVFFFFFNPHVS